MLEHIDHVNLVVQDLAVMVEFYCQVLDMQETKRVVIKGQWLDHVAGLESVEANVVYLCLLYTSPSPRDATLSRKPSSA